MKTIRCYVKRPKPTRRTLSLDSVKRAIPKKLWDKFDFDLFDVDSDAGDDGKPLYFLALKAGYIFTNVDSGLITFMTLQELKPYLNYIGNDPDFRKE